MVNAWREKEPEKDNPVTLTYFYDYLGSLADWAKREEAKERGEEVEP